MMEEEVLLNSSLGRRGYSCGMLVPLLLCGGI